MKKKILVGLIPLGMVCIRSTPDGNSMPREFSRKATENLEIDEEEYTMGEISFSMKERKKQDKSLIYYIDVDSLCLDNSSIMNLEIKDFKGGESNG